MEPVQVIAVVVSLALTAVGVTLFVRMIAHIVAVVRLGRPATRTDALGTRVGVMLREVLLHTRMLQWTRVGAAHWFVMVGFGLLFATLVNAYGQLFDAHFILPVIGTFPPFEWATELFAWAMLIAIVPFMVYRATRPSERVRGERGRFYGSTMWQGYFVEWVILLVAVCILSLRFLEFALVPYGEHPGNDTALHFPLTFWAGQWFTGLSEATLANLIWVVAMVKISVSMVWMIVLGLNATMGVAWHRFTAPFNILFKREVSGRPALGALKPLTSAGREIGLADMEELDETAALGVGRVEDLSWKGLLDLTTCTECGRCQSQCPAWNTEKPLSPKLLITALRDHAYAKAPYLQADDRDAALARGGDTLVREVERPLIGDPAAYGVIDPDVLWSCTTCGACVQQCPVDIEHVDHIVDMRRYQLLVESNFPPELAGLFRGLENKGNPWNMAPAGRMDWAQGLGFDVPVVGETVESLADVEWLFWVGCAGAYEDRAKKTTRAVAELLHIADVSFAVLGNGETCTGDPARRAGNEFVFLSLAAQNVETFREHGARKVVATCAHCFNTLRNEYRTLGVELEVVHHTQLLNRLVREGRLTPVAGGGPARTVTYHDPCYLGRHNQVYSPPRELLGALPGASVVEMGRNSERSFCCGAGGARMWMEERIGERINTNRTAEAVGTGADQIAVACPYCRVMLADGLTSAQATGEARAEVEVLDVAQMLLAAVAPADTVAPSRAPVGEPVEAPAPPPAPVEPAAPVAPPAAAASLFGARPDAAPAAPEQPVGLFGTPPPAAPAEVPPASLFGAPPQAPSEPVEAPPTPEPPVSLFGTPPEAPPEPVEAPATPEPPVSLFGTPPEAPPEPVSLFGTRPEAPPEPVEPPAAPEPPASLFGPPPPTRPAEVAGLAHQPLTDVDIDALESLFDIAGPVVSAGSTTAAPVETVEAKPVGLFDTGPSTGSTTAAPVETVEAKPVGLFDTGASTSSPTDTPAAPVEPVEARRGEPDETKPVGLFDTAAPARATTAEAPAPAGPSAPAPPAAGHRPRTDVDIEALDSLFDV